MIIKGSQSMIDFGAKLGAELFPNAVITLNGELGAGKTTLTKGIGQGLGVKKIISSPTFTIVKIYTGKLMLYHFDAYRLEGSDEDLGFEDMFEDGGVSVIEWPEFIDDIIPAQHLDITIHKIDDETREVVLTPYGNQYDELVRRIGND
ncbi:MAG: tRNA (adenosine(37)-N6)-threonylcarbamoyltransferase complex ATPase subunit type 1 TsaE [Erysipelotrichaceae bacterium]|nr:tRNA (adenosine(37)-N6)-threonylcarbamoyltransferase complex ATPase subunit type 1 TsaE [Erysipelotrichaceae bacterium]